MDSHDFCCSAKDLPSCLGCICFKTWHDMGTERRRPLSLQPVHFRGSDNRLRPRGMRGETLAPGNKMNQVFHDTFQYAFVEGWKCSEFALMWSNCRCDWIHHGICPHMTGSWLCNPLAGRGGELLGTLCSFLHADAYKYARYPQASALVGRDHSSEGTPWP